MPIDRGKGGSLQDGRPVLDDQRFIYLKFYIQVLHKAKKRSYLCTVNPNPFENTAK